MSLLIQYHLYILIAVLVGVVFLFGENRKKPLAKLIILTLAFAIGYELIMDEPVTRMPRRIQRTLNQKGAEHTENKHYYQDPIDRSNRLYKN